MVEDCGDKSFFKIKHAADGWFLADQEDCSLGEENILDLVECDSDEAALFSNGQLHKTSPKAYNLYSARCWLNEGLISVLATPSLNVNTCPEDHSIGACERIESNLDHFTKDVLFYEWSFNQVKSACDASLFDVA